MADESDERRDAFHKFLQEQGPVEDIRQGALLTGWVVVTSWVDDEGEPWLTKAHCAAITTWTANGMHHEALYGDWPPSE